MFKNFGPVKMFASTKKWDKYLFKDIEFQIQL